MIPRMTFEETQKLYKEEAPIWLESGMGLGLVITGVGEVICALGG